MLLPALFFAVRLKQLLKERPHNLLIICRRRSAAAVRAASLCPFHLFDDIIGDQTAWFSRITPEKAVIFFDQF